MSETTDAWTYEGGPTRGVEAELVCHAIFPNFDESGIGSLILRDCFRNSGEDGVLGVDCQTGECTEQETQFQMHLVSW